VQAKKVGKSQAQPATSKFWQVHAVNFLCGLPFPIWDICIIQNASICLVSTAQESKASFVYFCLPSLLMTMATKIQPLQSVISLNKFWGNRFTGNLLHCNTTLSGNSAVVFGKVKTAYLLGHLSHLPTYGNFGYYWVLSDKISLLSQPASQIDKMKISSAISQSHMGDKLIEIVHLC
jgi:hypothetical protein